jgi:hypothetical protein
MTTTRHITTAAIILSLAAAGAPAASARPADFVPPGQQSPAAVYSRPDRTMIPVTPMLPTSATAGGDFLAPAAPPPVVRAQVVRAQVVRAQAPKSGFDWGDAGIGAAGIALSVIGIGGAFAVSQRRSRRSTAVPS